MLALDESVGGVWLGTSTMPIAQMLDAWKSCPSVTVLLSIKENNTFIQQISVGFFLYILPDAFEHNR